MCDEHGVSYPSVCHFQHAICSRRIDVFTKMTMCGQCSLMDLLHVQRINKSVHDVNITKRPLFVISSVFRTINCSLSDVCCSSLHIPGNFCIGMPP